MKLIEIRVRFMIMNVCYEYEYVSYLCCLYLTLEFSLDDGNYLQCWLSQIRASINYSFGPIKGLQLLKIRRKNLIRGK